MGKRKGHQLGKGGTTRSVARADLKAKSGSFSPTRCLCRSKRESLNGVGQGPGDCVHASGSNEARSGGLV